MAYAAQQYRGELPVTITPPAGKRVILRYVKSPVAVTVSEDANLIYSLQPEDVFPGNTPWVLAKNSELNVTGSGHVAITYEIE